MFKFKKVASLLASTLMMGSTVALAAAANYPDPFVQGGSANVALVWGANAANTDVAAVVDIQANLNSFVVSGSSGAVTNIVTGGDSILLAKSSDNLNLDNTLGVFTGSVTDDDLTELLADGTYVADDNDEFDYEQKITLGAPTLTHFQDTDYEEIAGLDTRTPVLGFKIASSTFILNYTLDFTNDAESDIVSGDLDDIEGSDIPLFGKTYFVSDAKNDSGAKETMKKMTLLESGTKALVSDQAVSFP